MLNHGLNVCSNEDYHADRQYLSSSVLKVIYESLADYKKYYIDGEKKAFGNENALQEGSLFHTKILEPHLESQQYQVFPGFRKAGTEFEQFKATADSRTIVSAAQVAKVNSLVDAYKRDKNAVTLMQGTEPELTLCGMLHDVPIKVRFDAINIQQGYIADLKTTSYASGIDSFRQTLKDLKYELSAALYTEMAEQFYGKPFDFYFIVASKRDNECHTYKTSLQTMMRGRRMVLDACTKYKKAKESGIWVEENRPVLADSDSILEV